VRKPQALRRKVAAIVINVNINSWFDGKRGGATYQTAEMAEYVNMSIIIKYINWDLSLDHDQAFDSSQPLARGRS
jgi:hypothetical protein